MGQQALYHRLRSAPVGDGLETFEVLSERLRHDVEMRERAQLALNRLKDPQGYDVWWLGRPGAVEGRTVVRAVSGVDAAAIISIALVPFSPVPLIVMLLINMTIRYLVDRQIGAIVLSIRQCAPLIGVALALRFLASDDVQSITAPLRDDVPNLIRLKWISSWANGNPFMLSFDAAQAWVIVSDLAGAVYEYFNLFLLLDATGMWFGLRDLQHASCIAAACRRRGW